MTKNKFYVYCYKNIINNKCYIGKTNNISKRKSAHIRKAFIENSQLPFYRSLRKYGKDKFEFSILDEFDSEDIIFELEKFYIKAYKSNKLDYGYNLTDGGEGSSGTCHNENQKKSNNLKIGSNNGNSKLTEELAKTIFDDYSSGKYSILELSIKYCVAHITIERLLSGKSWKHINLNIESLSSIKRSNIINSNGRGSV